MASRDPLAKSATADVGRVTCTFRTDTLRDQYVDNRIIGRQKEKKKGAGERTPPYQSDDAFNGSRKESADSLLLGSFNGPKNDAGYALDDSHKEAFAALSQIFSQIGRTAQHRLPPFLLIIFVKRQVSQAFAQGAGDFGRGAGHSGHRVSEQAAYAQGEALHELIGSLNDALIRLVEKLFHAACNVQGQSDGVADDIQTEDKDVKLFDGLSDIVPLQLTAKLRPAEESVGSFKIAQTEDDVLHFRQTDADALDDQAEQLADGVVLTQRPTTCRTAPSRSRVRKTQVNL